MPTAAPQLAPRAEPGLVADARPDRSTHEARQRIRQREAAFGEFGLVSLGLGDETSRTSFGRHLPISVICRFVIVGRRVSTSRKIGVGFKCATADGIGPFRPQTAPLRRRPSVGKNVHLA